MNRFRTKTTRAGWWDYARSGFYFITICTKNKAHFFGKIIDGKMQLSPCGILADRCWKDIPMHHPNVELEAYVVMPNHIHGILILTDSRLGPLHTINPPLPDNTVGPLHTINPPSPDNTVGSLHATILQTEKKMDDATIPQSGKTHHKNQQMSSISPRSASVSAVVRSYKSAVTRQAHLMGLRNGWQPKYYDRIIRNDAEYFRLSQYIINNPPKWEWHKGNKL